jgi:hypothetical protein
MCVWCSTPHLKQAVHICIHVPVHVVVVSMYTYMSGCASVRQQ